MTVNNWTSLSLTMEAHMPKTKAAAIRNFYNETDWRSIPELVNNTRYSELTSNFPFNIKKEYDNTSFDPDTATARDWFNAWVKQEGLVVSKEHNQKDLLQPTAGWVSVDNIILGDIEGGQRIQFKTRKTARAVFERALEFDYTKYQSKFGLLDLHPSDPYSKFNGNLFAIDSGGSTCAAVLAGITHVPANSVVRITNRDQIGELFFGDAESKQSVSGEDKFKHKLAIDDPKAVLQHRLYHMLDLTPLRGHPAVANGTLQQFNIAALSKLMSQQFKNSDKTISGDHISYVTNEDMFDLRSCSNIVDVCKVVTNHYEEPTLQPALVKGLVEFYATFRTVVNATQLNRMIKDYKNGHCSLRGDKIDPQCYKQTINWDTMNALQTDLYLQGMTEGHRNYAVKVFAILWNHWAKKDKSIKKIQPAFIEYISDLKSHNFAYSPNHNYKTLLEEKLTAYKV
jgi:hypothetical protein